MTPGQHRKSGRIDKYRKGVTHFSKIIKIVFEKQPMAKPVGLLNRRLKEPENILRVPIRSSLLSHSNIFCLKILHRKIL